MSKPSPGRPPPPDTSFFSLAIISPAANSSFSGPSTGVVVNVIGTANDLDNVITKVEVRVGSNPFIPAQQATAGDWSNWSASYTVPTQGAQTIVARATDGIKGKTTPPINITISLSLAPPLPPRPTVVTLEYALKSGFNPIGRTIRLVGNGFVNGISVLINSYKISNVQFIDSSNLDFTMPDPATTSPPITVNTNIYGGKSVFVRVQHPDGTTSQAPGITMMLDTIVMACFGDSIMWGQGLRDSEKFHSLVQDYIANTFASNLGVHVFKNPIQAHSGAIIGITPPDSTDKDLGPILGTDGSLLGEIPNSWPSVDQQVANFRGPPEAVDLILIDGGVNDVDVHNIVNPFVHIADLVQRTNRFCYGDMKVLLEHVIQKFRNPETKIIVTGYFAMLSEDSNTAVAAELVVALAQITADNILLAILENMPLVAHVLFIAECARLVRKCRAFVNTANPSLQQAVDEVNAQEQHFFPRISFADPKFEKQNSVYASDPWLWGFGEAIWPFTNLFPEDNVAEERRQQCSSTKPEPTCYLASMSHPNVKGAQAYARAIISKLSEMGIPFADGTLLKEQNSLKVYIIYGNAKFLIPSPQVFNDMGLSLNNVRTVPDGSLQQIPAIPIDGTLLKEQNNPKVYIIDGNAKLWIRPQVFNDMGLSLNNVRTVPDGSLQQIPDAFKITVKVLPDPSAIKSGAHKFINFQASDFSTGNTLGTSGTVMIDNNTHAFHTNTNFDYVFHGPHHKATVKVTGYRDATIFFDISLSKLNATVEPYPVPLNRQGMVTVHATDKDTGLPVSSGKIVISNPGRLSTDPTAPAEGYLTNVSFKYIFRSKFIHGGKGDLGDIVPPTGIIVAPDYEDTDIDFGFG